MASFNSFKTVYASAARTSTPTPFKFQNSVDMGDGIGASGIIVVCDVTVVPGSAPSTTVAVQILDQISGKYINLLQSAAITAVGTYTFVVVPGVSAAADGVTKSAGFPMTSDMQITVTHGNSNSMTYSVSYAFVRY